MAISSLASLAAHLDLDPNDLTIATGGSLQLLTVWSQTVAERLSLSALPVVDGPVFYEDVVDIISAQGLRRSQCSPLEPQFCPGF